MNIVLTGGASGLGEAISRKLAEHRDWNILISYHRSTEKAKALENEFPNLRSLHCDFSNAGELQALCEQIDEFNADVLINNAYGGQFLGTHFHKTDVEMFQKDFQQNVLPVITLSQRAIQMFRKKKKGQIITVLTEALNGASPVGTSVYVAGKAYLQSLAKSWASEYQGFNIHSVAVLPGFMETNLTASLDERFVEQIRSKEAAARFVQPNHVAEVIVHLCKNGQHYHGRSIAVNAETDLKNL